MHFILTFAHLHTIIIDSDVDEIFGNTVYINPPPRNIKEVVEKQHYIHLEVMSSRIRVYIKVDSATVSD